jgi:hypothetical protein
MSEKFTLKDLIQWQELINQNYMFIFSLLQKLARYVLVYRYSVYFRWFHTFSIDLISQMEAVYENQVIFAGVGCKCSI